MAYGLFDERSEENKYPRWLRYLGMIYGVVLLWATFSLPPSGYDADSAMLVFLIWFPVILGLLYIFEKPALIARHTKAMRIALAVFAINAIIWGAALAYAFIG